MGVAIPQANPGGQMEASTTVLAEFLAMVKGRKAKTNVKGKMAIAKCLQCECAAKRGRRGLCQSHYDMFYAVWSQLTTQRERNRYEDEQETAGNILKARRGRRSDKENPFIRTA